MSPSPEEQGQSIPDPSPFPRLPAGAMVKENIQLHQETPSPTLPPRQLRHSPELLKYFTPNPADPQQDLGHVPCPWSCTKSQAQPLCHHPVSSSHHRKAQGMDVTASGKGEKLPAPPAEQVSPEKGRAEQGRSSC